ncbi:MAG TPA: DUF2520 domain-containing protein [Bacteroidetes bacterium]|nr:DUF2520 domain-containing protein [Bacteroidota bacterium]
MSDLTYSIIGAGNVAHYFGSMLFRSGAKCKSICARNIDKAKELASIIKADNVSDISSVSDDVDLIILAVSDDAIIEVTQNISLIKSILVHTSGNMPLSVLESSAVSCGVLYPLQTLTSSNFDKDKDVPLLLEANSEKGLNKIIGFVNQISDQYHIISSEQRKKIHLVAVLLNNFVNHLGVLSEDILNKHDLKLDILLPLLDKTIEQVKTGQAFKSQTGPAIRGDKRTMDDHIGQLNIHDRAMYKALSESINIRHKKK